MALVENPRGAESRHSTVAIVLLAARPDPFTEPEARLLIDQVHPHGTARRHCLFKPVTRPRVAGRRKTSTPVLIGQLCDHRPQLARRHDLVVPGRSAGDHNPNEETSPIAGSQPHAACGSRRPWPVGSPRGPR